ncbi:MAG: ABC transporter substrate-binding protein [Gaiellaceae bacterium]
MPERPIGTVTFLFTDIEGSTRLLQQLRERYDAVQSRHAEILRAAFTAHDGHEIDTQGDAFFAAFGRARDAVAAAVDAQRALAEEEWPQGTTVRVRMGLHTGEPLVGGERYVGMGVNRGARICSAAHGGQVLLSNTTRELVEDDLPGDVRLVDLGEHELKDLPRPERIFQLAVEGLPSSFPPLRTGGAAPLVEGREQELGRAAGVALRSRLRRRPELLVIAAILIVAAVVSAFVLSAHSPGVAVAANSVAAIDPSGKVTKSVAVGSTPVALAASSNALWVANLDDRTITHVDPSTGKALATISVGGVPAGIAASKGSVWVATGSNEVDRIDPVYNRLTKNHVVKTIGSFLYGATDRPAVLAYGSLWVVHPDGYVQQVDPKSLKVKTTVDVGNDPSAIAAGADYVWVANQADGTVTRIDPTTLFTTTIPVGHGPAAVAIGPGGVWVANSGDDAVVRIDPSTNAVAASVRVGSSPGAVLATPGAVWVANAGDETVMRIEPASGKVTKTIHLGGTPAALASASDRVWVAVERGPATAPAGGGVARITSSITLGSLDPALSTSGATSYATCAGLVTYPDKPAPEGSRVVPEIAEALPVPKKGGTTYTFRIRRDFRFSPPSNKHVTAESMKETIARIRNPRMKSPNAFLFSDVRSVTADGSLLTIRLTHPDGGFLANLASAPVCAVPSGTPIDPQGINNIPSAGPYYIASYTPDRQLVLKRNPNYRGERPHRLDEVVWTLGVDPSRGLSEVESGKADYVAGDLPSTSGPGLAARYGPGSRAAKSGHQQYFVNTLPGGRWLHMNVSRRLFASLAMRKAVNYAIDRAAIVAEDRKFFVTNPFNVGDPTDDMLTPDTTGAKNFDIYPLHADLAKARRVAGHVHTTAVMYAATNPPWPQEAQLIARELKPLGIDVQIKTFPIGDFFARVGHRGEPFDLAVSGWSFGSPDPSQPLGSFDGRTIGPNNNNDFSYFQSPRFDAQLDAASKLAGPRRYRTYNRLALDLERDYAPVAPLATATSHDFFSARIGCQVYQPVFGIDLAALCLRH